MKHIKQGYDECTLAVIAMLTGKSIRNIKAGLKKHTGIPWGKAIRKAMISKEYCLILGETIGKYTEELGLSFHPQWSRYITLGVYNRKNPDLCGRGAIVVYKFYGPGHIVAFEDGIIHDPDNEERETFDAWWKRMEPQGWQITQIQREKD